jgi:uncharacterized membrane protein
VLAVLGGRPARALITDLFQLASGETLPLEQGLAVEDRMDDYVGLPLYMLATFGTAVGTTLLTVAAWRAGWVHPAVPVLYVVAFVGLGAAPSEQAYSIAAASVTAVLVVALRVLGATDEEWDTGLALPRTAL